MRLALVLVFVLLSPALAVGLSLASFADVANVVRAAEADAAADVGLTAVGQRAPVTVAGDTTCPLPDDVAARASLLLPPGAFTAARAELLDTTDELRVVIRDERGTVATERRLPRAGLTCDDLAAAAATVIATFTSDVHPEFAAPGALALHVASPRARALTLTSAVGLLGSVAPAGGEAGWATGLWAAVAVGRRLGARLGFSAETERSFQLGEGRALARRLALSAGPVHRFDLGPVDLQLAAAATASWFTVRGVGFPRALSASGLDFGGAASALVSGRGRIAPFLALEGVGWPRTRTVVDLESGEGLTMARGEITLVLGLLSRIP